LQSKQVELVLESKAAEQQDSGCHHLPMIPLLWSLLLMWAIAHPELTLALAEAEQQLLWALMRLLEFAVACPAQQMRMLLEWVQ